MFRDSTLSSWWEKIKQYLHSARPTKTAYPSPETLDIIFRISLETWDSEHRGSECSCQHVKQLTERHITVLLSKVQLYRQSKKIYSPRYKKD